MHGGVDPQENLATGAHVYKDPVFTTGDAG